jgi:hypothetical protein
VVSWGGEIVDHLLAEEILFEDGGVLGIGPEGERGSVVATSSS